MLKLSIVHNIFLNEEDLTLLRSGKDIEIIGVSLPVWSFGMVTSEPAEEVFCKYLISNNLEKNQPDTIKTLKDGYKLYLPDYCQKMKLPINPLNLQELSEEDKTKCVMEDNQIFLIKESNVLSEDSEFIFYEQIHKIKEDRKVRLVTHVVKISKLKDFFDSLS